MSHLEGGPLSAYNSLLDPHLAGYFSNEKMKRHLRRSGLVTRKGEIITENSYRISMARKEHKKHVRDLLAQAIVHKTLDVERNRQVQVKKKLEEISKIELVRRVKADRGRRGDEDILPFLSPKSRKPRPSSVPAGKSRRPESGRSSNMESDRTYMTEGHASGSGRRRPSSSVESRRRTGYPRDEIDDRHLRSLPRRSIENYFEAQNMDGDQISSPYTYPHFNGLMAPQPPKATPRGSNKKNKRKSRKAYVPKETKENKDERSVEGTLMIHRPGPAVKYEEKMQTFATVTMHYFGRDLKLDYERFDDGKDEIVVEQQHCGGNTLIVFKERLASNSDFKFVSRRHRGFPFSLSFYVNGVKDSRISTCCEYTHTVGRHLGCKSGHFGMVSVEGAAPCYKCLVKEKMNQDATKKKKKSKKPPPSPDAEDDKINVPVSGGRTKKKDQTRNDKNNKPSTSPVGVPLEGGISRRNEDAQQNDQNSQDSDFSSDEETNHSGPEPTQDHDKDLNKEDYESDFQDENDPSRHSSSRKSTSSDSDDSSSSDSDESEAAKPKN